jgi:CRP/FNR family transcriptional regulator, cyclic AMP receptor protein
MPASAHPGAQISTEPKEAPRWLANLLVAHHLWLATGCNGLWNSHREVTGLVATPAVCTPVDLMGAQVESEILTLPTGAGVFERGQPADSIYAIRRGIVEVLGQDGEKLCYRPGELFSYQDILWGEGLYRNTAVARTPVEMVRLDRLRFLNLLHNHPTLALLLIGQQHERLREQRTSGTCCY